MRVDAENRNALDRFLPENADGTAALPGTDDVLPEALELLYAVLQDTFHADGGALEAEYNGQRETVQSLYWKAKELLEKTMLDPEKTGFLAMSVIEQTYERAKPLLVARVSELMSGESTVLKDAARLEDILAGNPYKKIWSDRSALYVKILERIGFSPDAADFTDLTRIMDPLLDALGFYKGRRGNGTSVYRVRSGPRSESRNPEIARSVCKYNSKKDLVDAVMSCGRDSVIMFGAVVKTHRQTTDWFENWYNGFAGERQRNYMRNDGITEEEYMEMDCDYTRCVYTCVKSGGTCWLVPMPYHHDQYSKIAIEAHAYYYGKRASYAPYEIFIKEPPRAPEGTTLLAIPRNGYLLSELMDPLSMAWFPAFMDETIKYFFKCEGEPGASDILLSEEAVAEMPEEFQGLPEYDAGNGYAVVPVVSGVPATATYIYTIKRPYELDFEPWFLDLLDELGVNAGDLKGVPILPVDDGDRASYDKKMEQHMRSAYVKLAAVKIAEKMADRWEVRSWLTRKIRENIGSIITQAGDGDLMSFMEVVVEGTPILDENGNQKMEAMDRYPYTKRPAAQHTSPDDARQYAEPDRRFSWQVFWASDHTSGKPPVVWKLRPCAPEHYAALADVDVSELPEILRLSGLFTKFQSQYKNALKGDIMNEWTARGYGDPDDPKISAYMPCIGPVNICMTKKAHASFPYFKPAPKPRAKKKNPDKEENG